MDEAGAARQLVVRPPEAPEAPADPDVTVGPRPVRFPNLKGRVIEAVAVVVAVAVPYMWLYRPWDGRWRIPLFYFQDANFHAMLVQNMILHGGYASSPDLGAPFGLQLHDFPFGTDHLHLVAMKALTAFTNDPFAVVSLYFALTFFLIALSAHLVLRTLGLRPLAAGAVAVLFAFLPYRFWHGNARVFLAAYYSVPLGVLLAVWVATDRIPLSWRGRLSWREPVLRRLAAVVACVIVVGSASPYYAVFTVCIVGAIGLVEGLRRVSGRPFVAAAAVSVGIVFVMVVNLSPSLAWRLRHGPNPDVAHRTVAEVDYYGLRFAQMLLPSDRERLSDVLTMGPRARPTTPGEDDAYIGVLGVTGLAMALTIAFTGVLGTTRLRVPRLARCLSGVTLVSILFGVVGGFSLLVAVLGFTAVRTWSRMVLFIAFCSLGILGLFAQHLVRRLLRGPRLQLVAAPLAVVVVALGLLDEVPKIGAAPAFSETAALQRSDRAFVAGMERALPARSMVFQMPVLPFPEGGNRERMFDYDLFKGYLSGTGQLRWSYGGMRGRESDWQQAWARRPVRRMVEGLAAAGFSALYVDRFGYEDRGASLAADLRPITGRATGQSRNGRLRWYDLRPVQARLERELSAGQLRSLARAVTRAPRSS